MGKQNKKSPKIKVVNSFPTISRYDLMKAILCRNFAADDVLKMSNMYSEILYMEKKDLKYIPEVTVSSEVDSEIYEMLTKWKKEKQMIANI